MRKHFLIIIIIIFSCDTEDLKVVMDLPIELNEVSGIETDRKNKLIWNSLMTKIRICRCDIKQIFVYDEFVYDE